MLKVIELFSGIGAQRKALEKANIKHKVVAISEIDKFALKSYNEIYDHCLDDGTTVNLGDITKINPKDVPDCDLMTYSFPCTDISVAGKQQGLSKGSNTRSSLLWECEKLIKAKRPKYLLLENVKQLVSKKFKPCFDKWLNILDGYGYNTYWQVLNAKDYGVPQNRERVFAVSIRKDIDDGNFKFPKPIPLTKSLKDLLEDNVDSKYYLSKKYTDRFVYKPVGQNIIGNTKIRKDAIGQRKQVYRNDRSVGTLAASDYKQPKRILVNGKIANIRYSNNNKVLNVDGCSQTLTTMTGGNTQPKVLVDGRLSNVEYEQRTRIHNPKGISPTIVADSSSAPKILDKNGNIGTVKINDHEYHIRKLTPKECWRLMGFDDKSFNKAQKVNSNTQLYKQAGNSIVVDCLAAIFLQMFK